VIYLANSTAAPLRPGILEAMAPAAALGGNPSSLHGLGQAARRHVDRAARAVAGLVASSPGAAEVVFGGSAEEVCTLAVLGGALARRPAGGRVVLAPELVAPPRVEALAQAGFAVQRLEAGAAAFGPDVALVGLAAAGAAGGLRPLRDVAAAAGARGIPVVVDGAAVSGAAALDELVPHVAGVTLASAALGGPGGVAALVLARGQACAPLWGGGGQQKGVRSGTLPVALIAGFGEAARQARAERAAIEARWANLRRRLEAGLAAVPGAFMADAGPTPVPRLCGVGLVGVSGQALLEALAALGVWLDGAEPAWVRIGFGHGTGEADIDGFLAALRRVRDKAKVAA
jgi:cysteine desulfurase